MKEEQLVKAYDYWNSNDVSKAEAARKYNVPVSTFKDYIIRTESSEEKLAEFAKNAGFVIDDVVGYWAKSPEISAYIRRKNIDVSYLDIRDDIIAEMDKHSPSYKRRKTEPVTEGLLVLVLADMHIGKLAHAIETGHEYNMKIAEERVRVGVSSLIDKAKLFGLNSILFVIGNDMLHYDTLNKTTTRGTSVGGEDTNYGIFMKAKSILVSIIDEMSLVADVEVLFVPSNHDYLSGIMLADSIGSWYRNHPNVKTTDLTPRDRKYVEYGVNLLGFCHGDNTNDKKLHWHMAEEVPSLWGRTKYRYWYIGHLHHKIRKMQGLVDIQIEKDHIGYTEIQTGLPVKDEKSVMIEYLRSPSAHDKYHFDNGFTGNIMGVEAFIHHPLEGQIARFTHNF